MHRYRPLETVLGWWSRGSQRDHCTADGLLGCWGRPPEVVKGEGDSTPRGAPLQMAARSDRDGYLGLGAWLGSA